MIRRRVLDIERRLDAIDLKGIADSLVRSRQDLRAWAWYANVDHSQDWPPQPPVPPKTGSYTYNYTLTGCGNVALSGIRIDFLQGGFTAYSGYTDALGKLSWTTNNDPTSFTAQAVDLAGLYPSQSLPKAAAPATNSVRLALDSDGFCFAPCAKPVERHNLYVYDSFGNWRLPSGGGTTVTVVATGTGTAWSWRDFGFGSLHDYEPVDVTTSTTYAITYALPIAATSADTAPTSLAVSVTGGTADGITYRPASSPMVMSATGVKLSGGGSSGAMTLSQSVAPSLTECRSGKFYQEYDFSSKPSWFINNVLGGNPVVVVKEP